MAKGSANKTWMIPMQFGDSLEQFAKALAKKDEEGVFRYEPKPVDEATREQANESSSADWFSTASSPEIAEAVAAANAVANKPVDETPEQPVNENNPYNQG